MAETWNVKLDRLVKILENIEGCLEVKKEIDQFNTLHHNLGNPLARHSRDITYIYEYNVVARWFNQIVMATCKTKKEAVRAATERLKHHLWWHYHEPYYKRLFNIYPYSSWEIIRAENQAIESFFKLIGEEL